MGQQKGVNTPRSTGQINGGIGYGSAQRTREHAGHVDDENSPPSVDHLQGNAQYNLHQNVRTDVDEST